MQVVLDWALCLDFEVREEECWDCKKVYLSRNGIGNGDSVIETSRLQRWDR